MPQVVVVLVKNGSQYNSAVVPFRVPVGRGPQVLTWHASGPNTSFPETNYFWWKTVPPPLGGTIPTRSSDGQTLTLSYDNDGPGEVWSYGVAITDGTATINIDPEIENERPPGEEEEDRKKKKDRD